jgi:pimeloyl-ACP methyl ester carboxylesterase
MKDRPDIIKDKIGIAAFSQGGWVSEIAAGRDTSISFLIFVSCPVVSPAERDRESAAMRLQVDGFSESDIRDAQDFNLLYDQHGRGLLSWDIYKKRLDEVKGQAWFPYVEHTNSPVDSTSVFYRSPYGRFYDPQKDLERLRIPVLAIYGQNDKTVPPVRNSERAYEYLKSSNERTMIVILPKANHGLIESVTGSDRELADLNRYAVGYFSLVSVWLGALKGN